MSRLSVLVSFLVLVHLYYNASFIVAQVSWVTVVCTESSLAGRAAFGRGGLVSMRWVWHDAEKGKKITVMQVLHPEMESRLIK